MALGLCLLAACGGGGGGGSNNSASASAPPVVGLVQLNAGTTIYSGNTIQLTPSFNYGSGEISWTDGQGNAQRRSVVSPGTPSFQDTPTTTTVYTLTVKYQDPTTVRPNELTITKSVTVTVTPIDITAPVLSLVATPAGPVASGTQVTLTPDWTYDPTKLQITKSEVSTVNVTGSTVSVTKGTSINKTITTNSTFKLSVEYVDIRETPYRQFATPVTTTVTVNTGPVTLTQTASMTAGRAEAISLLLPNGKVLVAGGTNNGSTPLKTAELYDPISQTWTATGSMSVARRGHTATLLLGGKVLVTGGFDGAVESTTAELYDPATGLWTPSGAMVRGRKYHTASRLIDGSVLIAGGIVNTNTADGRIAEIFNPVTATFTSLSTNLMSSPRSKHTATVLPNGTMVVLAGGFDPAVRSTTEVFYYNSTAIADSKWAAGPVLKAPRHDHTAIQISGSTTDVMLLGGYNNTTEVCTMDLDWTPSSSTSSLSECQLSLATMNFSRGLHTSTQLDNGKIVVIGGTDGSRLLSSVEVLPSTLGSWSYAVSDPILKTARAGHTSVLLSSQKILVTGSMQTDATTNVVTPTAELWEPSP